MYSFSVCSVFSPQSTVLECPLLGESFLCSLRRHAATLHLFLERTFPSPTSFSSCGVLTAEMELTTGRFVWVRLPNGKFHPGERSSILVLTRPPNRNCCRQLWFAEFTNQQLYSNSRVVSRWAIDQMAPVNGAIIIVMSMVDYRHCCEIVEWTGWWIKVVWTRRDNWLLCPKPVGKFWVIGVIIKGDNIWYGGCH